eukprot:5924669-Pyramimonas_sp.AAC.2
MCRKWRGDFKRTHALEPVPKWTGRRHANAHIVVWTSAELLGGAFVRGVPKWVGRRHANTPTGGC